MRFFLIKYFFIFQKIQYVADKVFYLADVAAEIRREFWTIGIPSELET